MEKLKTLKAEIKYILENQPETRDSNSLLYKAYLFSHGITWVPVDHFFEHFSDYGVSDFESVTRMRRKIVEENPKFKPSKRVQEMRYEKEVDMYDFMKGNR